MSVSWPATREAERSTFDTSSGRPDDERLALRARLRELLPEAQYVDPLRTELYLTRLNG